MVAVAKKYDKKKYKFDKERGERPIKFFEQILKYPTGSKAGKPFKLEKFQKEFIRETNGWVFRSNGQLKHRSNYFEVPKGNGKSPLMAGMAIYSSCAEGLKNGEIYILAGDRKQAKIMLSDCKNMINSSPALVGKFDIQKDIIIHKKSGTFIEALSSEAKTKHGPRPDRIFFDELHVQPNRELYDTMTKALFKKKNSQCYMITTAGVVNTFAETIHDYAVNVLKGVLTNEAWCVRIYAADLEDKPFTVKTWKKANPGYGTIINPIDFKIFATTAKQMPSEENSFRRLHLNQWLGSSIAWIPIEEWDRCNQSEITLNSLEGRRCWGGLDLASVRDTCSLSLVFEPEDENGILDIYILFWVPKTTVVNRTEKENINYASWVKEGLIKTTPGDAVDYGFIFNEIIKLNDLFDIESIAYDRKFAASLIIPLEENDIECTPFGQGMYSMSFPTKELEKMIVNKKINHGGNPVLRWQASNAHTETDAADNIKLNKKKSKDKIDGVVATVMAVGEYLTAIGDDTTIDEDYTFTVI